MSVIKFCLYIVSNILSIRYTVLHFQYLIAYLVVARDRFVTTSGAFCHVLNVALQSLTIPIATVVHNEMINLYEKQNYQEST